VNGEEAKAMRSPDTGIAKSTSPRTVSAISPASLRLGPPQPSRRSSANGSILRRRPIERGVSLRSWPRRGSWPPDRTTHRSPCATSPCGRETARTELPYGFRPGRSAHQALQSLRTGFMSHGLRWVIDLDIEKYFDSISHSHLRAFLDRRVTDGLIRRMIDKWLKAGVLEDGLLRQGSRFPWDRFNNLLKRHPLPAARIVHRHTAVSESLP
jgi:hypothetical protein